MARFAGDNPSRPQSVKLQMQLPQHRTATLSVMVASAPVKVRGAGGEGGGGRSCLVLRGGGSSGTRGARRAVGATVGSVSAGGC